MSRFIRYTIIISVLAISGAILAKAKTMSVQVREAQLRSAPSYLSRVQAKLNYAARVTVIEEKGAWIKVTTVDKSATGWLNKSSLSKKRLKMTSGSQDISNTVSTQEQALAGKGFNSDVEAEFKKENKNIDFTWVDKMGKIKISHREIRKFLKAGNVHPGKDGAK